jgi:hypothetical protein
LKLTVSVQLRLTGLLPAACSDWFQPQLKQMELAQLQLTEPRLAAPIGPESLLKC